MTRIVSLAAMVALLTAVASTADARGGASGFAPGQSFRAHGSVAGFPGARLAMRRAASCGHTAVCWAIPALRDTPRDIDLSTIEMTRKDRGRLIWRPLSFRPSAAALNGLAAAARPIDRSSPGTSSMSAIGAPLRPAEVFRECLFTGVDQKRPADCRNGANDPTETSVALRPRCSRCQTATMELNVEFGGVTYFRADAVPLG